MCEDRPCYPTKTAGPCMRPWQVAALGAFTLALAAPLLAGRWLAHRLGRG